MRAWLVRLLRAEIDVMLTEERNIGYVIGFAAGELKGRLLLADEIACTHSLDGAGKVMDAEAVRRLKARQVH